MKRFVLLSRARSGSTMLGSMIGQHPQVIMHGEIFGSPQFPLNFYGVKETDPWPTPLEIILKRNRDANPIRFLEQLVFADTARAAIGFKFKFEEFVLWPQVVSYIQTQALPILYLRRADAGQRYLSEQRALTSGQFNSTDATMAAAQAGSETFAADILGDIQKSEDLHQGFIASFAKNPTLPLLFEDLVANHDAVFHSVCDFIEVDRVTVGPLTSKRS